MKNRKLQLYILAWLAYMSFSMLAFPYLRITVMLFSIPLAMSGGWLYRYKGALLTTALSIPYHYLMLNIQSNDPSVIAEAFNPFGIISLTVFSMGTAALHSLRERYDTLNAELERIVADRTRDLRQVTDHLINMQYIDRAIINSGLLDTPLELLESMRKSSTLLCTSLEEQEDPEADNANIVQQQIDQCIKSLTDFVSEAEDETDSDATFRENVEKLSKKMMHLGGGGLNIAMDGECDHLDQEVSHQLYSIISEAVANAIRHAEAAEIMIQCRRSSFGTTICVENNGKPLPEHYQEGMGLSLMRHRAKQIGASLNLEGGADQRTRLICTVPLRATIDEKAFPQDGQRLNITA